MWPRLVGLCRVRADFFRTTKSTTAPKSLRTHQGHTSAGTTATNATPAPTINSTAFSGSADAPRASRCKNLERTSSRARRHHRATSSATTSSRARCRPQKAPRHRARLEGTFFVFRKNDSVPAFSKDLCCLSDRVYWLWGGVSDVAPVGGTVSQLAADIAQTSSRARKASRHQKARGARCRPQKAPRHRARLEGASTPQSFFCVPEK